MDEKQFQLSEESGPKLTGWKKEPTVQILKQDLEAARPSHNAQMSRIEHWRNLMKVERDAKATPVKGRSTVQPRLIRRQAEWRYSALSEPFLGSNKLFKVSPVTWEDAPAAKQNELVLNWQIRTKLNRVKFIDDFVRATVDEGTCVVRTGWMRTTVLVKQMMPVWTHYEIQSQEQAEALQQAIQMKQENPRGYDEQVSPALKAAVTLYEEQGVPTVAQQTGEQEIKVEKVLENRPTAEILNPQNVYIDPSCQGDINRALFVVVSFETNQAELRKQGKRYKNLDQVGWENNTPLATPFHDSTTPTTFNFNDSTRKKVVAYEYWGFYDINDDGRLLPFVATWVGNTMIRLEVNPYPDEKLPFVVVPYLPVKRELYGEPDAELLEDNQKILGAVTRGMIDLLGRSANSQRGMAKGMLDPLNRRRYDEGRDYEFNPSISPQAGIVEHKYPEIPQSALTMLTLQNQEAEALTGVKSFSGGLSGEAYGQVAAGIRGMLDAAAKREMAILRRLAKGMTEIGQKFIAMNSEFLSEEETVRITNDQFIKVKREDLKGNFDLEVDISTIEVDNLKASDMAFMLQTIGPNSPPEIAFKIMGDIADLKRMPELAHWLHTFKPQPSPEQVQMQQLQLEEQQLKNEKLRSEIMLNQAKAGAEASKKDKLDLDYVEQETGTAHAREMEKQRGQAKGNQALEVTKALTKPVKEGEKRGDVEAAIGFNQLSDKLADEDRMPTFPASQTGLIQ